jgi:ankyrin repeat protein
MRSNFKKLFYLIVFIANSCAYAGSYEDYFAAIESDSTVLLNALFERGFDPNTLDPKGRHGLLLALQVPAPKVIGVLLEQATIQVEVRTLQDESPLMLAALKGLTDVCAKLIAKDADVNKSGWTPLHYAATGGNVEIIRMLLENHAYIDAESPNGSTPLMLAAMYSTSSAVKVLLESGADSTVKNGLGLTAIDFARTAKKTDSIEIIAAFIRAKNPKGAW